MLTLLIQEARTDLTDLSLLKPGGPGPTKGLKGEHGVLPGKEGPPAPTQSVLRVRRADPSDVEEFVHTASQINVSAAAAAALGNKSPSLGTAGPSLPDLKATKKLGGTATPPETGEYKPGSRPLSSSGLSTRPPSSGVYGSRPVSRGGNSEFSRPNTATGFSRPGTATAGGHWRGAAGGESEA